MNDDIEHDIFVDDEAITGMCDMAKLLGRYIDSAMSKYGKYNFDDEYKLGMMMGMMTISTALCLLVRSQEYHYRQSEERFNLN